MFDKIIDLVGLKQDPKTFCSIIIDDGCVLSSDTLAERISPHNKLVVITDENVNHLYGNKLLKSLEKIVEPNNIKMVIIPPGESSKSINQYEKVVKDIADFSIDRRGTIIAFGGGVVGDLAGFVASTLFRGLHFIQIPTTLLAMVDSSIGGKTAINIPHGKNLLGTFHQPKTIFIDPSLLDTLPDREFKAGYAEVVKYGLIRDLEFFQFLEKNIDNILNRDKNTISRIIEKCCQMKGEVVINDEQDRAGRQILNFGHTFAHAYEKASGLDGSVLHGEAVAVGICNAFRLSVNMGYCSIGELIRVRDHFKEVGLPVCQSQLSLAVAITPSQVIVDHMRYDKKNDFDDIVIIFPEAIGGGYIMKHFNDEDIIAVLDHQGY